MTDPALSMEVDALYAPTALHAHSDPWLERRQEGFGASEIGALYIALGLRKPEPAHRLAHKLRDPKFYTSRTKRAVNSLTVERGPKGGAA